MRKAQEEKEEKQMIHTAQFYVQLSPSEVLDLQVRHGLPYYKIGNVETPYSTAITKWVSDKYGFRLIFVVDFIKLLSKTEIVESDCGVAERRIGSFLYSIFGVNLYESVVMTRIDYRLDVKVEDPKKRMLLLYLYSKTRQKYGFFEKNDQYDSSLYFNCKSIVGACYDKEEEAVRVRGEAEDYEENVLRFEVRVFNQHLNHMKSRNKRPKILKEYFKEAAFESYMEKYLTPILFEGDFYRMDTAVKTINNSDLSDKDKMQLIDYLQFISESGIDSTKGKYTKYYLRKFSNQLKTLYINPILIPDSTPDYPQQLKNPFVFSKNEY
jgi:hypothetical protein